MKTVKRAMTTKFAGHRATLKKIRENMSFKDKMNDFMCNKLYQSILRGRKTEANILSRAIKVLFPKTGDGLVADTQFMAFWKLGKYRQAIRAYLKGGRPFWHTETVARYYERHGLMGKAIREYEYLTSVYCEMGKKGILPLPKGPRELFVLGKWFSSRDKGKAQKYLKLYLSAEGEWKNDPAFYLRHKKSALRLLNRLGGQRI